MIKPFRHDRSHQSNKTSTAPGTHLEVLQGIKTASEFEGGFWKEEVDQWADAYHALNLDKGRQMENCRRLS